MSDAAITSPARTMRLPGLNGGGWRRGARWGWRHWPRRLRCSPTGSGVSRYWWRWGPGSAPCCCAPASGFAGAFRALIERRDASGFRAHAVMLALATVLMLPLLAQGTVFGQAMHGEATPVGVGFVVGALLFGAGNAGRRRLRVRHAVRAGWRQ